MSGTLNPEQYRGLVGEAVMTLLDTVEAYDVAWRLGYGSRRSGLKGGRATEHSDPTLSVMAAGSRARGACRKAERCIREAIREREEPRPGIKPQKPGPLFAALAALDDVLGGAILSGEKANATDTPNAPKSETAESIAARRAIRRRRQRDTNPVTREPAWGDA